MSGWDSDTLARLRQVAIDLTSLSATVEVMRARHPRDQDVERAATSIESMIRHVEAIVDQLRER